MLPRLPHPDDPFVLLDDARPVAGAVACLYRDPVEIVAARTLAEVRPALARLRAAVAEGLHGAGYLHYEAGFALEPVLAGLPVPVDGRPLLWFGLFPACTTMAACDVPALLARAGGDPVSSGATAAPLLQQPVIQQAAHAAMVRRTLALIAAGDIYQANLTFDHSVTCGTDPLAAYAAIRPRAAMAHGALVRHDGAHILSFSPESFFAIAGRTVETRPMKGTAVRHADPLADAAEAEALAADPKQRAENLMIVDLLRNDLARVCAPGSVAVPDLFAVERYPTVHQMVSRVTGRLAEGVDAVDVLATLFPCGSITGAPKIRAMQVIAELEGRPRGIYTGSIGVLAPDGDARFNVAIRTISVEKGAARGTMGIGSGIVADSIPAAEWAECLAKARFVESAGPVGQREGQGMRV